jgi:hypothetical protein
MVPLKVGPHVKRRVVLALVAVVAVLGVLTAIVAIPVSNDFDDVRERLEDGSVADLDAAEVTAVREDVRSVIDRIHSVPGRILGVVPIWSSNLDAIEAVADELLPVIDAGLELQGVAEQLEDGGVISDGRVDIDAIEAMRAPLDREIAALKDLEEAVATGRSGLNLPPVWDAMTTLTTRVSEVRRDAESLAAVLDQLDGLLGVESKRTYVVMLLNNSELRGGGGVMTGVGTMTVENGKMELGEFDSVHDLSGPRIIKVPAPPVYERRYARFLANTSIWLNAAYSPDIPDDALVASRLLEKITGIKTQGAIVADPRGIAALLPSDAKIPVPGSKRVLTRDEVAGFTYSGAYESFTSQDARRDALIGVGSAAFEIAVDEGLRGREVLEQAGHAIEGGHLRVVSFDEEEQAALVAAGVTGELPDPPSDGLLVLAQNRGDERGFGSKLDYWVTRDVGHQCDVVPDAASCVTRTKLTNETPKGLSAYAAGTPYGIFLTFLETYVPDDAEVTGFEVNDESTEYLEEAHEGWTSVGTDLRIEPGDSATVQVAYDIPLEDSYALTATPQPLAEDAAVEIVLRLPQDWIVEGPGRREDEIFRYEGPMDDRLVITAEPDERTGLPAMWQTLVEFWQEPLF